MLTSIIFILINKYLHVDKHIFYLHSMARIHEI